MSIKALPLPRSAPPAYERAMIDTPPLVRKKDMLTADVAGHRLEVIVDGDQRLERILALLGGAIRSIDIIMYIFEHDSAGSRVLDAMTAAARRGVRVRAVIDSFGSSDISDSIFTPLREH